MAGITYERHGLLDSTHDGKPLVSSKRLGFTLYIGLTIMLFAALFGGWFVLRGTNEEWPPAYVPAMTILKVLPQTILLLLSLLLMRFARRYTDHADYPHFRRVVFYSFLSSVLFMIAFGLEWARLIAGGVGMVDVFGAMYFVMTGVFIAHFIGGVIAQVRFLTPSKTLSLIIERNAGFANSVSWYYLMFGLWVFIVYLAYLG
jgi:heme/copper-type cytochrome/quinol oxidase subunit 3